MGMCLQARLIGKALDPVATVDMCDSCVLIGFWVLVVVVGMASRLLSFLTQNDRTDYVAQHHEGSANASVTRTQNLRLWFRRVISTPATFSKDCRVPQMCVVPPRIESLTIASFIIINVIFCFTGYRAFVGNL